MNRKQRRAEAKSGEVRKIPLDQLVQPRQTTLEEARQVIFYRLQHNLEETKHPFHHLTANGVIVTPDPTLEYFLGRLPQAEREEIQTQWMKYVDPEAPPARPVNRKFYGFDMYQLH